MTLVTVDQLHTWTLHPKETLRTWTKRGRLHPIACHVHTRALLYDALEAVETVGIRDAPLRRVA